MTKSHAILGIPLFVSLLATAFCVWSALGNDVNFCVTTGCTLYQDFTLFGLSLWWYGTAAFTVLAACSILGLPNPGRQLSALFLLGDICLLFLMSLTAPCVSCLVAAFFFAISYWLFRRASLVPQRHTNPEVKSSSVLLWIWTLFFVINLGLVARSQIDVWPILDESGEARARMFFSPSCRYCIEGINVLSGNINMAFYPVAENDDDVYRIIKMRKLLAEGMSLAEAFAQSADFEKPGFFGSFRPDILVLRFHLLSNKAHIFASGSQGVPFFEYLGLPPDVRQRIENRDSRSVFSGQNGSESAAPAEATVHQIKDATLPVELGGQCGAGVPCDPIN